MDNMDAMMSSKKQDHETPDDLFKFVANLFPMAVDVAASAENTKIKRFYDEAQDGLKTPWSKYGNWCNPPYERPEPKCSENCAKKKCEERGYHLVSYKPGLIDWIRRAHNEAKYGSPSVLLIPARTAEKWFQYAWASECLVFLKGRLKFKGAKSNAPFPSALAIFGYKVTRAKKNKLMEIGQVIEPWRAKNIFGVKTGGEL